MKIVPTKFRFRIRKKPPGFEVIFTFESDRHPDMRQVMDVMTQAAKGIAREIEGRYKDLPERTQ